MDVVLRRLEAEVDEMWSFVQKKANKQWIWIAMDATTRQIIAFHVGGRSHASAKELWANMPLVYREQATFHTDQYDAYTGVIPAERLKAITKKAQKLITAHASTIPYGNACPVWYAQPARLPKSWRITSALSKFRLLL